MNININDLFQLSDNNNIKLFSYSKVKMFKTCPMQYYRWYVLNDRPEIEKSIETKEGLFLHEFADKFDVKMSKEEVENLCFELSNKINVMLTTELCKYVENIINFLINIVFNNTNVIIAKEKNYVYNISDDIVLNGTIDLCYYDGKKYYLIDYKTSKKVDTNRFTSQLMLYMFLLSKALNINIDNIVTKVYYVCLNKEEEYAISNKQVLLFMFNFLNDIKKILHCSKFVYSPGYMCKFCCYLDCPKRQKDI